MMSSTRRFCLNHPDIFFTRADKGNVTVVMNRAFYDRMLGLLNDNDMYVVVKKNSSKIIEKKLNNLVKDWQEKNYINKKEFYLLRCCDAPLSKTYGLPKIHKQDFPFRLIVSCANSSLYNLTSFLNKIICNSLPQPVSFAKNSFELYGTLSGLKLEDDDFMFSLDVASLFTNFLCSFGSRFSGFG